MNSVQKGSRLTEKDWRSHESVIRDLFLKDGLPLRKVKDLMEEHHQFTATDRQWKHRIKRWKLDRNIKDREMRALVRKRQHRAVLEPDQPQLSFRVRKFEVESKKILRWMKEHAVPDDQLYAGDSGARTPSDISCYISSRQGSPSANGDVEMNEMPLASQTSPTLEHPPSGVTNIATLEPTSRVASVSESSDPRCWVKTTDLSWAFDAPWEDLLEGHENDPEGRPLAALVSALREEALEQDRPVSNGTLAALLRGDSINHNYESYQSLEDEEIRFDVTIKRKRLPRSILLVLVRAVYDSDDGIEVRLNLRLRTALDRYYHEGFAEFRIANEHCDNEALFNAIDSDDHDEVERMFSAGEATVFHIVDRGRYPIATSAFTGNLELTRLLLERGSPVHSEYRDSETFIWDIWEGFSYRWVMSSDLVDRPTFEDDFTRCKELMNLAFDHGAHLDECIKSDSFYSNVLFHINEAVALEHHEFQQVLQYLLHLGVDIEYRNSAGWTPLLYAVWCGMPCPAAISAYLDAKANICATDYKGRGCLHLFIDKCFWYNFIWDAILSDLKKVLTMLLRADPRYKERPLKPLEIPLIDRILRTQPFWSIWREIFSELNWDFTEMEQYAMLKGPPSISSNPAFQLPRVVLE